VICPRCCGIDDFFNEKLAARELKRYRRRGPIKSTRILIETLTSEGVERASLLDIGGGIGAIQHELIKAGASRVLDVDGSPAYLEAARQEAQRLGHAERARFRQGDFVDVAQEIEPADIVTLDRVICCYPDMPTLVARSAARARALYGLVYPRDRWLMKVARPILNCCNRLRRSALRFYLHPPADVDRVVRDAGLRLRRRQTTLLWQVVVYGREA
jgi:magnesium-protoporphyrin O-methyltransferase